MSATTKVQSNPSWLRWKPQPLRTPMTPEQLHTLVQDVLAGDPISILPVGHDGSPGRVDTNGGSKQTVRDLVGNVRNLQSVTRSLSSPSGRLALFTSTRCMVEKRGKSRPIDIPSEIKRFHQLGWMVLSLIPMVIEQDALDPRVVGFRTLDEFEKFTNREDGVTIQDVFADTMIVMVREHGPYILMIDLQDAYGNLPHRAIKIALQELLGLNHDERRQIIESARIRTRLPNRKLMKPKGFGIEQGSPIGPLVFNLVQSLIARRLRAAGFESGCFGDDIGIAAKTETEATRAFEIYQKALGDLGFNLAKLRPLGDPQTVEKASCIYNCTTDPVPLIRTYMVTFYEIRLTADKEQDLIDRLRRLRNPSFNDVVRLNKWKAASKSYLRRVWMTLRHENSTADPAIETDRDQGTPSSTPPIPTMKPGTIPSVGEKEPVGTQGDVCGACDTEGQDTEMPLSSNRGDEVTTFCLQGEIIEVEALTAFTVFAPYSLEEVTVTSCSQETFPLDSGQTATASPEGDQAGVPHGGRMSVPRDGSAAGVTPGVQEVETDGHPVSTSKPVLKTVPLKVEHALLLAEGRRLRVGDNYRPEPALVVGKSRSDEVARLVLDLRAVSDRVPESRRAAAVRQLIRVASQRGRADLLVHPGDGWLVHLLALDGDGHQVRVREDTRGVLVTAWKVVATTPSSGGRPVEAPPPAPVVLDRFTRSAEDRLVWAVRARTTRGFETRTFRVSCFDPVVGRIEALAQAMIAWPASALAFRAFGQALRLLNGSVRLRQVDLHAAVRALPARTYEVASPNWILSRQPQAAFRSGANAPVGATATHPNAPGILRSSAGRPRGVRSNMTLPRGHRSGLGPE